MTSSASFTSSASLELMQSQQKCFRPNFAARFGSCSVSWREIIVKAGGRTAVEARPERRFANRLAAGERHAFVIVRRAADHVGVGFDVAHKLLDSFLPCHIRFPPHSKLACVRSNNPSGVRVWRNFVWIGASFDSLNQMSIFDNPCACPLVCVCAIRMAKP